MSIEHAIARQLYIKLRNLVEASKAVVENWERGNLAGAVTILDATQADAETVLALAADAYEPVDEGH